MDVFVCGNPFLKEDCLPLLILPKLKIAIPQVNFIEFEPTEDLPRKDELIIIDTVINAKEVVVLHDVERFVQGKALSMHDCDLGFNLKIAKKMKWLNKLTIIGLPPNINQDEAVEKIKSILSSRSVQHNSCMDH